MSKIKIKRDGQPCRKCGTPVIKINREEKAFSPKQKFYYAYYFSCLTCGTPYYCPEAIVYLQEKPITLKEAITHVSQYDTLVTAYSDGCTLRNGSDNSPGSGGAILMLGEVAKPFAEFLPHSTNNTAEITGAIVALESLRKPCDVILYSDSAYVIETMRGNYRKKTNLDYWNRLERAASRHNVSWNWVKGHARNRFNEEVDRLCGFVARGGDIKDFVIDFEQWDKPKRKRKTSA